MKVFFFIPILLLGFIPLDLWAGFTDVSRSHPFAEAIFSLQTRGIIKGYDDGSFGPENPINRAEIIKMLLSLEDLTPPPLDCKTLWGDVNPEDWFAPWLCKAKNQGLIDGYDDGTFKPSEIVNFAEGSKIFLRKFGLKESDAKDPWFAPFVYSLAERKAIPISIESYDQPLRRGEVAEIIFRLERKITDRSSRDAQLQIVQWEKSVPLPQITPLYQPFTQEGFEQALGNRFVALFFFSEWEGTSHSIDRMITESLEQLPRGTVILKVPQGEFPYLQAQYQSPEPNSIVLFDRKGQYKVSKDISTPASLIDFFTTIDQ